jgi:parallel beta-helix repeat protein
MFEISKFISARFLFRRTTLASAFGILLLLAHTAQAQLPPPTAADTASHSAYDPPSPEWTTGDNGGFGMGPWTLNPASNTPQSGFFVGSSTGNNGTGGDSNTDGDINTAPGSRAWGLYANSGQTASAVRNFLAPFTPGSVFEIYMDNGDVQSGGTVGFALRNGAGQELLEVYFVGGNAQYTVHGNAPVPSGVNFTREGVRVVITLTTASTYQATLTRLVDGAGNTVSGTLRNNPGPISQLRLFNANAGAGSDNDLFFNRITYYQGRVLNTDTGRGYLNIQPAIDDPATLAGHTISVSAGLYTGTQNNNIVINKPRLTLIGAGPTATVISRTASGTLRGIEIAPSITGTTISSLRVQGFNDGGICAIQNNHFTTITNTHVYSNTAGGNCLGGIYMNGPVNHVLISHNEAVNNTSRGIVIWNGFKTNITITHNLVRNNNCCGIELQDGTASGVLIAHNTVRDNFDNGIGTVGLTAGAGPNLIYSNTLINNGRFGIEVKLPNGSGLPSGDGSIVVLSNTVALTDTIANIKSGEQRDLAGIAAFRRAWVAGFNNVDIPAGVIIQGNVVSGYQQPSASDGFGIVVEGARMTVISNTLENNDVGVQVQAGHTPYAPFTNTDGDQSNLADQYFGRGNSPVACAFYQAGNVFTGNLTNTRQVGTVTPGTVSNLNTGQTFCGIQQAIDAPPTLGGHVLSLTGDTFTGTVIARKPVAIVGAGPGQTVIQSLSPGIVVTTSNVTISNTSIVGTGSDVGITTTFGVTNLTVSNVHISNFAQGVALLGGHSHSVQNSVFTLTNVITSVGVGMTGLTITLPITNVLVSGNVFTGSGFAVVGIFADQNVITGNQMRFGIAGVRLAGANGNLIEGNQIENNSSYAIYLAPDAPPLIPSPVLSNSNNVISGNVALNHPNDRAIQIINSPQPGNGNQIVNNVVQNAGQAGILTGPGSGDTNLLIAGNTVITANPGIVVGSSVTATITNNQVSGGSIGIQVANSSKVVVISNTTSNNGDGISVESGSSHVTVTNNAASSANNGFRITNSSAVTVTANQATNSTTGFFVDNGSNAVALFNNQAQSLNTGVRVGSGATNVTLASNTVDGTALSLELQNSSHVVITGNTLINSGLGFSITNGAGNLVTATFNVITSTGGVLFNSGNASGLLLSRNNLANNTGVTNTAAGTLNAECNWYGAANGPSGAGSGSGTPVSTGVDFNPWLLSDDLNGSCSSGSLTVQKVLVGPITPTTAWQFTATVPTGTLVFTLPAGGGAITFSGLDFGPATITETPKLGYIPTSSCTTGATGGASISFNLIGDATCTFTNTLEAPTAITLTAIPTTAVVGSSVLLTATVTISDGTPAADGTVVTFTASLGSISPLTATTIGGVVTATLNSTVASVAAVTATVNSLSATALVTFTPGAPFTLTLTAVPATLPVGNSSTLTATATDQYGNPVADGTTISFTTSLGALSSSTANTSGGDASVTLSSTVAGVATVTATIGSLSATAQVTFARVFNMNTGLGYVGIQQAIDDPQTLNGHTISVTAGIYTELVSVTKQLTLLGAQHGQDALARTAAFVGGKADPTVESIIYTPINNPTGGNPGAADLFRVLTHNVTIDGFVFDGNNPALLTSTVQIEGVYAHARRGVTNIGPNDSFNPLNNLVLRNNVFQNFGQRGVSLANDGPLSVGNLIERNVLRRIRDQAIILFTNAYADIVSNTVKVPVGGIGLHLQNFSANNSMAWLSNTVTIITNAFGIHANLFYAPSATLLIRGNMVNADAASALPSQAVRGWGINVWSIQQGSTVIVEGNRVGLSGGRLGRGINVWNVPTNNTVRVTSNAVANSTVGVNFDNVDLYFGGGQSSTLLVTSNTITGTADGVGLRVRVSVLESDPLFGANAVSGHGLMLISDTTVVSAGVGLRVETGITSTFMASATLHNSALRNNGIGIQVLRGALTATHNYLLTNTLGVTNTGGASVDVWLNRNAIVGNGAGITNTAAGTLNAECNWYGAVSGPSGVGSGSGDSVSTGVDFNPWLLSDDLNGPCSSGSLTIQKVLVGPITPTTAWQFTATVPTGTLVFTLPAGGGAITFSGLDFGPATITETTKLGYSATSSCTTGATGGASISFNLIGNVTCTFTNTITPATTVITVTPVITNGWFYITETVGPGTGLLPFDIVLPPPDPTLGAASARLVITNVNWRHMYLSPNFTGTRLSDITAFEYRLRIPSASPQLPYINIGWDDDVTDGNTGFRGRLVYSLPSLPADAWHIVDARNDPTPRWYTTLPGATQCTNVTPCTFTDLVAAYPNAAIHPNTLSGVPLGFIGIRVGGTGSTGTGYADGLRVGVGSQITLFDFEAAPPTTVTLTANPTTTVVGNNVLLTATVTIANGDPAADGTVVSFTSSLGNVSPVTATTVGGVVTATLTSTVAGVATVTATVNSLSATTQVTFTAGAPFTLTLTAVPATLPVGNSSTLTATATDQYGNPVADGTTISFTTSLGALSSSTANTSGGDASVTLSSTVAGVATVTATIGSLSATAQVTFARVFNMNTGLGYVGIQQAIDDPQTLNGHTISVTAGIYTELVSVTKQLTLLGAQHGQDALARTAAFVGGKADSTLESIIYTPINNPTGGNPGAADLFRVLTHNVTIDGFVFDGNNPALLTSTVQIEGVDAHARRGVTNIGPDDSFNPLNNLILRNNVFQNFGNRGVSLDNNGPVSTGNLIERNVLRRIYDRAIILVRNAYADVVSNTIDVPVEGVGLWMQTFYSDGSMAWLSNTVTIMTDAFGIHVNNLFNALSATIVIRGNVVNAAASVAPEDADLTWGINVWSVFAGWGVLVEENRVGLSGGRLGRGINVWNVPTNNTVRVTSNAVANSTVGINFDNVDPYYGGGQSSTLLVTGNTITGTADGIGLRVRVSVLESDPLYASNVVSGHGLMVISNTTVASASVGLRVETGITSTFMASATLHNSALRNNGIGIQVLRGALTATHNYLLTNTLGVTNTGGASVDVWLNRNAIVGNGAGITNTAAGTLNAECNWYGAVSGPSGVGSGSGDSVSTGVDFNPWLLSDDLNGPCSSGSLTIQKVLVGPITPTTAWQFTATVPTGTLVFTLPAGGGAVTFGSLDFGPVTITETPKLGYIATSSCTTGATGGASIAFSLLGDVTCIFTNTLAVPTTITLSADPSSAVVNSSVLLTATVSDQFGNPVTDGTVVSFTTSLGNVSPVTATTVGGVVTATLTSTVASVATVTATVNSLSATTQVTFTAGAPFTLTLTAVPATLSVGNSSTLTATATDQFGNPVADGTTISFTTSLGNVSPVTATTVGGVVTATLNSTVASVAAVTATVGSLSATAQVTFTPGAPFTLTLTAVPSTLPVGNSSTLTATATDQYGNVVANGTTITFTTSLGTLSSGTAATSAGNASVTLSSTVAGVATVTATVGSLSATAQVTFTPGAPFTFTFTLTPTVIVANGISQSVGTATVVDQYGNPVGGVTVNFLAGIGTFSPASGATNASGQVTATLTSLTPAIENVFAVISGLGFRSVQVTYVNPPASSAPLTSTLQTVTQTLGVVRKGGFITYTLVVTNSGPGQVNNVLIYAPIPSGTTYVAGSASGGNFSGSFAMLLTGQEMGEGRFGPQATLNAVTWSGNLAAGASHTLSYVVQVQILEGQVVNQPKVFVDNADTGMNLSSAVDVVAYKLYVPIVRRQ